MDSNMFDINGYRQRLASMSTEELERFFRQIDPVELPQQWRAAVEELTRRGYVFMPGAPGGQPQFNVSTKRGKLPLGVKIGCLGCLGSLICTAIILFAMFNELPKLFGGVVTSLHTTGAKNRTAFIYDFQDMSPFNSARKKETRAGLFEGDKTSPLPSPPENGTIAWDSGRLLLLGAKGEYILNFDERGAPAASWEGPRMLSSQRLTCQNVFEYQGRTYFIFETSDGEFHLVDGADGSDVRGPMRDGFAQYDSVCPLVPMNFKGQLYILDVHRESRSGGNSGGVTVRYSVFDGKAWAEQKDLIKGKYAAVAITVDSEYIWLVYNELPENSGNPFSAMKGMGRVKGVCFDGKDKINLAELDLKGFTSFDIVSDGTDLLLFNAAMGRTSPDIYALRQGKWKLALHGEGKGMNMATFWMNSRMMIGMALCVPLFLFIVWASSWMIFKERGAEAQLAGRTVRTPTLMRRFGAFFVDALLFYPVSKAMAFLFVRNAYGDGMLPDFSLEKILPMYLIAPATGLLVFLYFFLMEGYTGRTLGKRLFGLRVVRDDLTACTPGAAALRALLRLIDGIYYYIIAAICFAHTEKFQRLGDLAAHTVVIMDEPGLPLEKFGPAATPPPSYVPPAPPGPYPPPPQQPY